MPRRGALRQRRRRREFGCSHRPSAPEAASGCRAGLVRPKAAAPGLDLPRQVGSPQAAMDHHGCQELLVLEEVDEAQVAQHGRHLPHRIAAEASGIAFEPPLEREQPGLDEVGADDGRKVHQHGLPADTAHLGQKGLPAIDVRKQTDAHHEIEGPIGKGQRPEARSDEMQPAFGLLHQRNQALGTGRRAALDPDLEAERQQQGRELGVATADIEHAPAPDCRLRQQALHRLRLNVQQVVADRPRKAQRIGVAGGLDVGHRRVIMHHADQLRPARSPQHRPTSAGGARRTAMPRPIHAQCTRGPNRFCTCIASCARTKPGRLSRLPNVRGEVSRFSR